MKELPVGVKQIEQKDNYSFVVLWSDGVLRQYRLSEVQKCCPCAQCQVEGKNIVDEAVRAMEIQSVGKYAMKIRFTSGCSKGIYTYTFLRYLGE